MTNRTILAAVFATAVVAACASAPEKTPPELLDEASTQIDDGVSQYNQANYLKAGTHFEQAMYLYRSIDNPRGIASSYIDLAKNALAQNHLAAADHWVRRAQAIVNSEHLADLQNHVTIIDSSIAISKNDFSSATKLLAPLLTPENSVSPDTRLAALQNRTRIAFAKNENVSDWVERYAKNIGNNNPLAQARLDRFRAALGNDLAQQNNYFKQALDIYRTLAWRPGLASTLSEWAKQNTKAQDYTGAKNKLERALFIQLDLRDSHGTTGVLTQMKTVYGKLGNIEKQQRADYWIKQLGKDNFYQWDKVMQDFET